MPSTILPVPDQVQDDVRPEDEEVRKSRRIDGKTIGIDLPGEEQKVYT